MGDRNVVGAREGLESTRCARKMHAAAGEDQRALGRAEDRGRALNRARIGTTAQGRRGLMRGIDLEVVIGETKGAVADILWHIDHDRSRPSGGRDREGAAHQLGDA